MVTMSMHFERLWPPCGLYPDSFYVVACQVALPVPLVGLFFSITDATLKSLVSLPDISTFGDGFVPENGVRNIYPITPKTIAAATAGHNLPGINGLDCCGIDSVGVSAG